MTDNPRLLEKMSRLKTQVMLSSIVSETERLRRSGRELVGLCPFHAENSPSFTVRDDKYFYHCFGCGAHGDLFDWLAKTRGMSVAKAVVFLGGVAVAKSVRSAQKPASTPRLAVQPKFTVDLARSLWLEATGAIGSPVEAYLRSRGLDLPTDAPLRFHPACPRDAERLPAMLALMTKPDTGEPTGVHRTFLRPDGAGKAPGLAKMMLGNSGVIRLVPTMEVTQGLGIAEGIETSFAVMQRSSWHPVWAAGAAGAIAAFPILGGVGCLTIFCDRDDKGAGLTAARTCADRWLAAGREAVVYLPPAGTDWLDALVDDHV